MNYNERLYSAISRGVPDAVPVVPKIWVDFAARYTKTPLHEVVADPQKALDIIFETGVSLKIDAVRLFNFPERRTSVEGSSVYEIANDGKKKGVIDLKGGLSTHLYNNSDFQIEDPYIMANYQFWSSNYPFIDDLEDAKRISVPNKTFLKQIGWESRQKKIIRRAGERIALIGECGSATLAFYVCLRGMSNAMLDLYDEPKMVHRVMEKGAEIAIEKGKLNLDLGIKILRLNDSVANMSVISPEHWREYIKPHIQDVCSELHNYNKDALVYCHICGNILPIVEDLVETGLDCIGPLDPLGGFSCKNIRDIVGDRVALMGGINTMSFINSTEQEIYCEAIKCMMEAGESGGFVLGSGCVVPRNAKIENIRAIINAAREQGQYRNGRLA